MTLVFSLLFLTFTTSAAFAADKAKPADAHHDHDKAATAAAPDDAKKDDLDAQPLKDEPKGPTTVKVGLQLIKLNKFEMGPGTYSAEFYVLMQCNQEPCKPELEVNGKISSRDKIKDEKLVKEFKIKADLEALVDLSEFPFDKHLLPVALIDKNPSQYVYEFDQAHTGMDDGVKLAGWQVSSYFEWGVEKFKQPDGTEQSELQFFIALRRPLLSSIFKSLVPVFFMAFIAGFQLLLKPKSAAGRLAGATGALTGVVMFHLSSTSSLPPLGYMTLMDKFMIATYLVYLVNIAFSVAMVRFEEKKNEKMSELMYLVAGGAVPGVALISWLAVFLRIA
jgi:hypothetical protein